ncbi:MAG: hypothetical protein Q9164_003581 [Protoblastenia rupestris]
MVSLSTLKTLLFTLGPLLLPKAITWYRTARQKTITSNIPIQPLPTPLHRSLNILFITALLALLSTLPFFSPENIFTTTSSRLQTPNDVLFTRLASIRFPTGLTHADNTLRPKIASLDARLLYLTYGPDVLTNCPFCNSDEPSTYFYYALPAILFPHILHLFALGLATSNAVAGKVGNKWRTTAAAIGLSIAFLECYFFATRDWKSNAKAVRPEDYVLFFWRMRTFRGLMLCLADAVVAGLLYLTGTNRMFVTPPTSAERMEMALRGLEQARGKLNAVGIVRNAIVRDEGLRRRTEGYWIKEGKIMGEVMDEREVVEGIRSALSERVQVGQVEEEARKFAEGVTAWPTTGNEVQVSYE